MSKRNIYYFISLGSNDVNTLRATKVYEISLFELIIRLKRNIFKTITYFAGILTPTFLLNK